MLSEAQAHRVRRNWRFGKPNTEGITARLEDDKNISSLSSY